MSNKEEELRKEKEGKEIQEKIKESEQPLAANDP
jgi:hypothetical protein